MYRILYNDSTIFDPYGNENEVVTDASMSVEINAAAYMDFTMYRLHPLYNTIAERDGVVTLYWDSNILFQGVIESIDIDVQGNKAISCVSALDYLNDTVVRPYSTIAGEQKLTAPSSVDGYFKWLIDQHNEHVLDSGKRFDVGVNQGANLQQNNFIYRSSTNNPTTASEISDQLLDSLGGYLTMRYVDDRYVLDLYADLHTMNTQIVDFGVNITDFSKTIDTKDQYTALILKGGSPEFQGGDFESGDWSHWVTHPNEPLVRDKTHGGDVSSYFVSGAGEYVNDSFFYFRSGRRYKATVYVKNERGSNVTIHGGYQYEQSGTWTTVNVGTSLTVENKGDQWTEFSFDFQPNLSEYTKIRPRWYFDNVTNDGNRRVYLDDFSFSQVSGDTDVAEDPISVSMVPDGGTKYDSNVLKTGDVIYDPSSVSRYGYKEKVYEDSTITDVDDLLQAGIKELNKLKDPQIGLNIKAVDLALFMEGYTHLNVGDAVRVRSAIHDTDEFLMVNSITLDLQDPGQSEYVIGKAYDSLTGKQSGYLRSLNSGINSSLDAVASLDQTAKDQAIQIGNVEQVANDASEKADTAQNTANSASSKADKAQTTADTANTTANKAQTTATEAKTTADSANKAAEELKKKTAEIDKQVEAVSNAADAASAKADQVRTDLTQQVEAVSNAADAASAKADQVRTDLTQQVQNVKSEMDTAVEAAQTSANKAQSAADAAQKAADKANASTADLDKSIKAVDAKAIAAKQAAAEAQSKAENVASDLDSANAVIEQHTTELGELTTKVTNAVKKSDSALSVSTEAKQTATEASTTATSAYADAQTALTQSTTATQTATAAKTTAESASKTASDSLKQSSAAVQTANQISTTLRTEYQTKADADKLYATQSSLKQTSDSITASVSKTYATKDALSALQNVADNAIESWRGTGVPTLTNKPASDWTTDAEKKKHSGDLYYDKSTGKAYRFGSDDGETYTWELNQDTDVTKALEDAANAQTSANNAQASATAANTAAGNAQSTANTAVSNAATAKHAADAAQSSANKAQGDVDKLKIDIPETYATKSSLTQTAESITANVESVKTTANSAVTAASKAQQTADGISANLTKNYQTKSQADTIYATKASLKATSDSISAEVTKAQGTADGAVTAASNAQQTADAVTLNLSKNYNTKAQNDALYATKTSLKATSDSLSANITANAQTAQSAVDKATSLEANLNGFKTTVAETYQTKSGMSAYATNSSLTQTANSIKAEVTEVSKTANGAMSKATTVEQTANGLSSKITEQGRTLNATVKTANEAKSTADSNKATISQVSTTASNALTKASSVEQNLNGFKTTVSQTYGHGSNLWVNPTFDADKPQITSRVNNITAPNGSGVNLLASRDHHNNATSFPVVPGHKYVITAHIKRLNGYKPLNAGIWYTSQTSGKSYDTYVGTESTSDLSDGWMSATWRFSCPNGKSRGCVFFQIDQSPNNITTQWYISNVVCVDVTGLQPAGDYSTKSYVDQTAKSVALGVVQNYKGADGSGLATKSDISVAKDSITSTVSKTYATKAEVKQTYATKTEFKQTLDSFKTSVSETYETKTDSLAKQSTLTQKVDGLRSEVSQTYETKTDALNKQSTLTQKVDGLRSEVSQTYETKTDASSKQSSLQQSVNNLRTEVSEKYTTKTEFETLNDSATKTYQFHTNVNSTGWYKLGEWTATNQGDICVIAIYAGAGQNAGVNQNRELRVYIKDSYQSTNSSKGAFGVTVDRIRNADAAEVQVRASASNACEVWYKAETRYAMGRYVISIDPDTIWTHSGSYQTSDPSSGTLQTQEYKTYSTKSYVDQTARTVSLGVVEEYKNGQHGSALATASDITAAKDSITSTVSKTYATKNDVGVGNLIKNGDFSDGTSNWTTNGGTSKIVDGTYGKQFVFTQTGTNTNGSNSIYNISYNHVNGQAYEVSFYAKADKSSKWHFGPTGSSKAASATLDTTLKQYTIQYQAETTTVLSIWTDNPTATIHLERVKLSVASGYYATKTEVKQTTDSLTVTISSAVSKAESAATAASNAQNTANTAKNNAATAQNTANTANNNAQNAQNRVGNLETCIKMTADGVRVGKISNGTFTGYSALMNSSGSFDVLDGSDAAIAKFSKYGLNVKATSSRSMFMGVDSNGYGYIGSTPTLDGANSGQGFDVGMAMGFAQGDYLNIINNLGGIGIAGKGIQLTPIRDGRVKIGTHDVRGTGIVLFDRDDNVSYGTINIATGYKFSDFNWILCSFRTNDNTYFCQAAYHPNGKNVLFGQMGVGGDSNQWLDNSSAYYKVALWHFDGSTASRKTTKEIALANRTPAVSINDNVLRLVSIIGFDYYTEK